MPFGFFKKKSDSEIRNENKQLGEKVKAINKKQDETRKSNRLVNQNKKLKQKLFEDSFLGRATAATKKTASSVNTGLEKLDKAINKKQDVKRKSNRLVNQNKKLKKLDKARKKRKKKSSGSEFSFGLDDKLEIPTL